MMPTSDILPVTAPAALSDSDRDTVSILSRCVYVDDKFPDYGWTCLDEMIDTVCDPAVKRTGGSIHDLAEEVCQMRDWDWELMQDGEGRPGHTATVYMILHRYGLSDEHYGVFHVFSPRYRDCDPIKPDPMLAMLDELEQVENEAPTIMDIPAGAPVVNEWDYGYIGEDKDRWLDCYLETGDAWWDEHGGDEPIDLDDPAYGVDNAI